MTGPSGNLELKDFDGILKAQVLLEKKPRIIIMGQRCPVCGHLWPFIFHGETLYYMMNYSVWHQYLDCECGTKVFVDANHGDIIYNGTEMTPLGREVEKDGSSQAVREKDEGTSVPGVPAKSKD